LEGDHKVRVEHLIEESTKSLKKRKKKNIKKEKELQESNNKKRLEWHKKFKA